MTAPKARPGRPALSLGRTGDLPAALTALATARDQAAHGRRVIKAAATGRRAPATRPGALRDLVEEHLRKFPDAVFTPHQVGKVLTRSAGAVANALTSSSASVPRRWSPTSRAATASPPPPSHLPRTPPTTPASAQRPHPAPRNARHAPTRPGRRADTVPAAPSARCTRPRAGVDLRLAGLQRCRA